LLVMKIWLESLAVAVMTLKGVIVAVDVGFDGVYPRLADATNRKGLVPPSREVWTFATTNKCQAINLSKNARTTDYMLLKAERAVRRQELVRYFG
jgi:hypothetical protein